MSQIITQSRAATLRSSWEDLKKEKPTLRIRDCAEQLGVSEAELLATTVGDYTTRLEGEWPKLLSRFPELGRVMSLSRNDSCVLEHKGTFQKIDIIQGGPHTMATVIGPIETRVFFNAWRYGFAVKQPTPHGLQQSIQIFDEAGAAVTKIFFLLQAADNKPGSNQEAFDSIVSDFSASTQENEIEIFPIKNQPTKRIGDVDNAGLLTAWENMKDTHDFFGMLRKFQVNRHDAVELSEGKFSLKLDNSVLEPMLERAASDRLPIMIFAGNRGNLQIHQGKVQTIKKMDQWLNVLDPDFNMHLKTDQIESVWVVKKPTSDGIVTGIEVFDKNKEMIVQFFGLRKPGIPELEKWRELIESISQK